MEHYNDSTDTCCDPTDEEKKNFSISLIESRMNRGEYLRALRQLEYVDKMEREQWETEEEEEEKKNCQEHHHRQRELEQSQEVFLLPNNQKILSYEVYLSHQRYYDDFKHVDMNYIDYGPVIASSISAPEKNLIIEQRKSLGKGGICWDAAFVLAEHVIAIEEEWNETVSHAALSDFSAIVNSLEIERTSLTSSTTPATILELGAGTGLCGLMIAKATNCHAVLTDLPELMSLIEKNVMRNFIFKTDRIDENRRLSLSNNVKEGDSPTAAPDSLQGVPNMINFDRNIKGTVSYKVLRWGIEEDYTDSCYDVVIGADIVASLYDPIALAKTLHALSAPHTKIYISGKSRLDKPHQMFDQELRRLFEIVTRVDKPLTRLKNPDVFVMVATNKK